MKKMIFGMITLILFMLLSCSIQEPNVTENEFSSMNDNDVMAKRLEYLEKNNDLVNILEVNRGLIVFSPKDNADMIAYENFLVDYNEFDKKITEEKCLVKSKNAKQKFYLARERKREYKSWDPLYGTEYIVGFHEDVMYSGEEFAVYGNYRVTWNANDFAPKIPDCIEVFNQWYFEGPKVDFSISIGQNPSLGAEPRIDGNAVDFKRIVKNVKGINGTISGPIASGWLTKCQRMISAYVEFVDKSTKQAYSSHNSAIDTADLRLWGIGPW